MAAEQIGSGQPDGVVVGGSASEKVAFFGATPTTQPATIAAVDTTAATSSSPFGYSSSTQANAIVTAVNSIIEALKALGIIANA